MKKIQPFVLAIACIASAAPAAAADTISATHVFPASLIYSRSFLEYVKKANDAGKAEFTIQVRGGPEAIGMMEQPGAVRSGVVDMVYTPCAFYAAVVPECDAVASAVAARAVARREAGDALERLAVVQAKVFRVSAKKRLGGMRARGLLERGKDRGHSQDGKMPRANRTTSRTSGGGSR